MDAPPGVPPTPSQAPNDPDRSALPPAAVRRNPGTARSWLFVIGAALLAALLLRVFVFEAYRIPSTSMEDTLLVGDFVFVSKLHYGPRLPITVGFPFTDRYLARVAFPPVRLPGLVPVQRGDVVVFNYPPAQAPIDRREHYIKRVYGLPGDTLRIDGKQPVIGTRTVAWPPEARHFWRVHLPDDGVAGVTALLDSLGYRGRFDRIGARERLFAGSFRQAQVLRQSGVVDAIEPYVRGEHEGRAGFPASQPFTLDTYGPIRIPQAGLTVPLTDSTWALYREVITRFEGHRAARVAGGFEVDGALVDTYTFASDYYFVLGDNRDDSADSRSWGFVPADHLVGRAVLVYFSWDPVRRAPRWDRFFRPVRRII